MRSLMAIFAVMVVLFTMGCTNGTDPVTPRDTQTPDEYFNSFDLSNPAVAEFTYYDTQGNVLASGLLGRNDDGMYLIESRGAQIEINLVPLGIVNCYVTYNNPHGTIGGGPNTGLPYYLIGQTVDYDVDIVSYYFKNIGGTTGGDGLALVTAEMHYASWDTNGLLVVGGMLPGLPVYTWSGIIVPGYQVLNDTFLIVAGTNPGLDVTTVRVEAPIFFGLYDVIYFDGVAGIWDPIY